MSDNPIDKLLASMGLSSPAHESPKSTKGRPLRDIMAGGKWAQDKHAGLTNRYNPLVPPEVEAIMTGTQGMFMGPYTHKLCDFMQTKILAQLPLVTHILPFEDSDGVWFIALTVKTEMDSSAADHYMSAIGEYCASLFPILLSGKDPDVKKLAAWMDRALDEPSVITRMLKAMNGQLPPDLWLD